MIENSQKVLGRIQGLDFNEVSSKLCCRRSPDEIFKSTRTDTIVTPNVCCYSFLNLSRPVDGPQVKFISQILCETLGI